MNDECEPPVPQKFYFCTWSYFTKNMPMPKNAAHAEKPKECGFLCGAQSHFSLGCNLKLFLFLLTYRSCTFVGYVHIRNVLVFRVGKYECVQEYVRISNVCT